MSRIVLVTAIAALALDDDLAPLLDACARAGIAADVRAWDDPAVSWARYDLVLLRSTWDYTQRLPEFLTWLARVETQAPLLNPPAVVRRNVDKHYLAALAQHGVPVVPTTFVEPGDDAGVRLDAFLHAHTETDEIVVKPAVGAGSRDCQRYPRAQRAAALAHLQRLLAARRSALLQPYLADVDTRGETALVFFDGQFSHAIRKGALLPAPSADAVATATDAVAPDALFAAEHITPRTPSAAELALAQATLAAFAADAGSAALPYARVDLIHASGDGPRLLELELTEPSLFLAHADGAADRCAAMIARRLG